jgi:hypothetical protein
MAYPAEVQPPPGLKVRPSAWWYALVAALWVIAIVLLGTIGATFIHVLNDGVTAVRPGGMIAVPAGGSAVYAPQPARGTGCTVLRGGATTKLDPIDFSLTATFDGHRLQALASTPKGLAPGSYQLRCRGLAPGARLWTGDRVPVGSLLVRAIGVAVSGVVGLVVLVLLLIRRHLSKTRVARAYRGT